MWVDRGTTSAIAAGRAVLGGLALAMSLALAATGAAALDLAEARRDGAVLKEALALGAKGEWEAAEARVRRKGDPLLTDIVLWRKLRAGQGTLGEYRAYAARRPDWPGHTQLREVVLGERGGGGRGAMPAAAAERWSAFSRVYRKKDYDQAAVMLRRASTSAETLGLPVQWADRRRRLARREAREGRAQSAYEIASRHYLRPSDGYSYADCEWIAGWVALRKLDNPAAALGHFQAFEAAVETPISLARGGYWIGRAEAALGNDDAARAAYARAAEHQTAFYGQLAAAEIDAEGDPRLASADLPDWRTAPAIRTDEVRMAATLHYAGQSALTAATFHRLGRTLEGEAAVGALAALALDLGLPHLSVRVAKYAARRGMVVPPAYYPLHPVGGYVDEIEPALALSISRQETELNPVAVSPAGARGLMQLMPGTAKLVAGQLGEPYSQRRLLTDWRYNARLGQRYLADRVRQFGGSYVLAAAAYNAGPHRAERWSAEYGDPRLESVDVIDWIEQIPFRETRNYVQRVMEGLYTYRARISGSAGPMTIKADLARGTRGVPMAIPRPSRSSG